MTYVKILSIILILLTINSFAFCQRNFIQEHYNQFDKVDNQYSFKKHISHKNELEQVASALFIFYKKFISSQDYNSCVFEPSCSVYSIESIKKMGFIRGWMNTFDRISRCHGLASEYYPVDQKTQLLYDPVK
jgi:putative membrane protein insertion efficiency factor